MGTEKEYIEKTYPIMMWEENNRLYISKTEFNKSQKIEIFWVYDNDLPKKLSVPISNIKIIKNDTISEPYAVYVSEFIKHSKIKLFADKAVKMKFNETYAIIYVPKSFKVTTFL